ncbi:hypothetical protein LUZ61_015654 [Rhynchospora tenuis]|uniref:F-box domain-containing protein n=1 Tax=Rhynchospora tenuis TaxID=198213 RepID=A0AAD6EIV2_9POAL|nr:hypothetical protein LUZ61_015654 [Rhynchospora tenuis]
MEMEAMNAGEEERDWACLPSEMLNLVAKCLNESSDFVRFRAICHAWRSSTPITDLPSQFPWILDNPYSSPDTNLRFYSPSINKTYTIPAPRSLDKKILSGPPSHGYMATLSHEWFYPISLLNPLTNHEIYLPACPCDCNYQWIGPHQSQIGEYVIPCYGGPYSERTIMFFCHPGPSNWQKLKLGSAYKNCHHFYLRGMLFSLQRSTGVTKVTSIANGATTLVYDVPPFEGYSAQCYDEYLVEDSLGNILRVSHLEIGFDVYRLDVVNKNGSSPCWVKVSDIGNQAIFIDADGAFVLRSSELSGIKKNSIYHLKKLWFEIHAPNSYRVKRIEIDTPGKADASEGVEESIIYVRFKAEASEKWPAVKIAFLGMYGITKASAKLVPKQLSRRGESVAGLRPTLQRIVADIHERLAFCAQSHIHEEIANYRPSDADLDFPKKLERTVEAASTPATTLKSFRCLRCPSQN